MRLRKIAAASTLALTAAGLTGLAASPAGAATPDNPYTCKAKLNGGALDEPIKVTALADTNLPAASKVGQVGSGSLKVTVDEGTAGLLYAIGGRKIDGSGKINTTANGAALPFNGSAKGVAAPASGPIVATLTGPLAPLATPGATTIALKTFQMKMRVTKSDNTTFDVDLDCTVDAGAPTTVDSTVVSAAVTKTAVKAKGAKGSVTVNVTVTGAKTGKVKISVLGKKKVNKTVAVKNGKAKLVVKKLKKGTYKVSAAYVKSATAGASKSKVVKVKVK